LFQLLIGFNAFGGSNHFEVASKVSDCPYNGAGFFFVRQPRNEAAVDLYFAEGET
jgi:hypothetical protein